MSETKGIVMESGPGYALILLENGEYRKFKTRSFLMPGDVYQGKVYSPYPRYIAVAAALVIMLLGTIDFFNVLAYAQVSSGVEMGINRWNRVISVSAINTEGESILQTIEAKGQKLEKAVEMVLEESLKQDNESSEEIVVSVQTANNKKKLSPGIDKELEKLNASEGNNKYGLKRQAKQQDKIIYGLSKKDRPTGPSEAGSGNKGANPNSSKNNDNKKPGINPNSNKDNDNKKPGINPNSNKDNDNKKPGINPNSNKDNDNKNPGINPNSNKNNDNKKPGINPNSNKNNDNKNPGINPNSNKNNDNEKPGIKPNSNNKNNSPKPRINPNSNHKNDSQKARDKSQH